MDLVTKFKIMNEIRNHVDICIPVGIRYRIRCPICGDSQKDPTDTHCYIKCSDDPDEPLLYKCFLANCEAEGKVDKYFLKMLGINSKDLLSKVSNQKYNRIGQIKNSDINIVTGSPIIPSPQTNYIEKRLGYGFTFEDYDRFKIIWDMESISRYISNDSIRNTLPSNSDSISFLSDDKSMIFSRSFIDGESHSEWNKKKILNTDNASFYTIKTTLNLFTSEEIIVNIAEGIFDVLSVYKNCDANNKNSVYIGLVGGSYIGGIEYAINKGFIGKNITMKIYVDSNVYIDPVITKLKRYKWLFNKIMIYINILGEDMGVLPNKIKLMERRI